MDEWKRKITIDICVAGVSKIIELKIKKTDIIHQIEGTKKDIRHNEIVKYKEIIIK